MTINPELAQDIPQFDSVSDSAELLGVCRSTVYSWIRSGKLKARLYGGRRVILRSDLVEYLNNLPIAE